MQSKEKTLTQELKLLYSEKQLISHFHQVTLTFSPAMTHSHLRLKVIWIASLAFYPHVYHTFGITGWSSAAGDSVLLWHAESIGPGVSFSIKPAWLVLVYDWWYLVLNKRWTLLSWLCLYFGEFVMLHHLVMKSETIMLVYILGTINPLCAVAWCQRILGGVETNFEIWLGGDEKTFI